jgi:DNA helicase-4
MLHRRRFKKTGKYAPPTGNNGSGRKSFKPSVATNSGIKVRSQYEKRFVRFLDKKSIEYQYEPLILLEGKQYRPDFYLPEYNLFVEICGYGHMPFYSDRIEHKRRIYNKHNLQAIFIHFNGRGSLENTVKRELEKCGILLPGF